jgi:hypothetical protein
MERFVKLIKKPIRYWWGTRGSDLIDAIEIAAINKKQ